MNINDFYKYIESPDHLNAANIAELQDVLEAYPYFQTMHLLYLKALYNQNNFKFNDQLKFSSVHLNNRKKLLYFLKDKHFLSEEHVPLKEEIGKKESETQKEKQIDLEPVLQQEPKQKPLNKVENKPIERSLKAEGKESNVDKVEDKQIEKQVVKPSVSVKKQIKKQTVVDEIKTEVKTESKSLSSQEIKKDIKVKTSQTKESEAQKIIQKRLAELAAKPKSKLDKQEDKSSEKTKKSKLDLSLSKLDLKKTKEKKESINDNDDDVLAELSDLIQVAAPTEYFVGEELKVAPKREIKQNVEKKLASVDKQSFSYWLDYLQKKKESTSKTDEPSNTEKKTDLIDNFLSDPQSKIIRPSTTSETGASDLSSKEEDTKTDDAGFMTDTLAQIYIKQKYYDKAIDAYHKLSLKYPKKNTYFAGQIEKIKKLQINS